MDFSILYLQEEHDARNESHFIFVPPWLHHVVPLSDRNFHITMPSLRDAECVIWVFKCGVSNYTALQHVQNEYAKLIECYLAHFDINRESNFTEIETVIGMEDMVLCVDLCYTRDNLTPGTYTVYPKKYAHGFCFAVLCCGYTLTDFPISIRLTSLALWQSNDCPSASKATLMNMDKHFMWIHYERLHNHNKAKHNKTVCIFLGIYCMLHTR